MMGHADDLRDDVPGLPHLDGVADAQPELPDKIFVVQRCAGDRRARKKNRIETGSGGQHAGAAHRHFNAAQSGLLDFRRVFERDGPARKFVGGAHEVALREVVHLDDSTVHVEIQLCTILADLFDLGNGGFDVVHHMVARRDRQSQALEVIQAFRMLRQRFAADLLHIEHKDGEPTLAGDLGVLLAQGTSRSVARVLERGCALQLLLGTQLLECLVGHIHFTAHFQKFRRVFQLFGDAADGADVGGHVLAHHAVAAGGCPDQLTIFVFQAAGKTINFDLHHILRFYPGFPHAAVKVPQFVKRKGVQKAFHFDRVSHLGQFAAGRAADLLGGRRGRDQLRELRLQRFQFPGQGIVLKIFQLRRILIVIQPIVLFNDRAQFFHALCCLFQFQILHAPALHFPLPRWHCKLQMRHKIHFN